VDGDDGNSVSFVNCTRSVIEGFRYECNLGALADALPNSITIEAIAPIKRGISECCFDAFRTTVEQ